jgi:hypothetical protein
MEMEWKEPPARRWDEVAQRLRANPGKWGAFEGKANYMDHIKKGKLRAFRPAGQFEVRSHAGQLFIRYIGEQS